MVDDVRDRQIDSIIQRMAQCVDKLSDLNARMGLLIEQQAQQTNRLDKLEARMELQMEAMKSRISDVERWVWRLSGAGAAVLVAFEMLKIAK
jgi:4-diphosphocytidyl-2C-methyl-D-erythritol kinase